MLAFNHPFRLTPVHWAPRSFKIRPSTRDRLSGTDGQGLTDGKADSEAGTDSPRRAQLSDQSASFEREASAATGKEVTDDSGAEDINPLRSASRATLTLGSKSCFLVSRRWDSLGHRTRRDFLGLRGKEFISGRMMLVSLAIR